MLLTAFWVVCLTTSTYAGVSPDFTAQLLVKAVEKTTDQENVIVSPYSLLGPLGALAVGTGYSTRGQILDVLGLDEKVGVFTVYNEYKKQLAKLNGVHLKTANKIYISKHEKINHRFNSQVKKNFDLQVQYIDFNQTEQANQAIVEWIRKSLNTHVYWKLQTKPNLKALLVDAVTLDAPWGKKFSEANMNDFHVTWVQTISVKYIKTFGSYDYTHSKELKAEVVSIPLKDETCKVVIALPDFFSSVESIVRALNVDGNIVTKVLQDLRPAFMNLTIPSFNVGSTINLKNVLKKMGVERAFDDDEAQIRRTLRNNSELFLNEATQHVYLLTHKGGIKGGASDDINISPQSTLVFPPSFIKLYVNRPFYIEVRCSDIVLFRGIIRNPEPKLDQGLGQCCGGH